MARKALPKEINAQITRLLKEMEVAEAEALGDEAPLVLEAEQALWYVAYRTDAV